MVGLEPRFPASSSAKRFLLLEEAGQGQPRRGLDPKLPASSSANSPLLLVEFEEFVELHGHTVGVGAQGQQVTGEVVQFSPLPLPLLEEGTAPRVAT